MEKNILSKDDWVPILQDELMREKLRQIIITNEPNLKKYEVQAMNLGFNRMVSESPRHESKLQEQTFLSKPNETQIPPVCLTERKRSWRVQRQLEFPMNPAIIKNYTHIKTARHMDDVVSFLKKENIGLND